MAFNISKYYRNMVGLDLRVSDLLRSQDAATEAKNIMYRETGAMSKRMGYQIKNEAIGGAGLVTYNNVNIGTGVITEELLAMDDNLHKYTEQSFTITYTGATTAYYDLYLDDTTATFKFDLYEDNVLLFSQDVGTGQGASDTTVAELKTLIDNETNFSTTLTDVGAIPVAYCKLGKTINLDSSGISTPYYTWTQVNTAGTYAGPFVNHWAIKDDEDFEIASTAQLADVIYFANGYDDLHKYDGNKVYKAGLPKPDALTDAVGGAGSLTAGDYKWKYTFEHTDAKQNILTGLESDVLEFTSAGSDSRILTLTNLTLDSGYNTSTAVIDGNQVGVNTITVTIGHGLDASDQVYINDGISGLIKREVLSTTATTITIDGDAVDVTDDETISPIKITLWRTRSGGSIFYLEKEFVNDTTNATTDYTSTSADTALVIKRINPIKVPKLPPSCRYIDVWRGQLIMTGNRQSVNTVYYSDFDGENFPFDQSFVTESRLGGGNSGVKSLDNTLFIFKPKSVIAVSGDLGTDNFQVDGLGDDGVGCVAHATIKEINGVLWFLGNDGIYTVNRAGHTEMSDRISPLFNNKQYRQKRSVAHYWIEKDLYFVSFPVFLEDGSSEKYLDTTNSFIMVFDLYRQGWYEWNKINTVSGVANFNGDIHTLGFAQDPSTLSTNRYIYKFLSSGLEDDYADHQEAIAFSYKSHWEALGEPSVYKKFLRIKVHSLDGTINDFESDKFTLRVNTEHDYVPASESILDLDFSGGSLGWGSSPWGTFPWGESRLEQLTSKLKSKKARAVRTVFSNSNLLENILISGYELEIALPYDTQIKE